MDKNEFKNTVKYLIDTKNLQQVLETISEDLKERETAIEERHNRDLGFALEIIFPLLMEILPRATKKQRDIVRQSLNNVHIQSALKTIKADHPCSCPSMKHALVSMKSLFVDGVV